MAHGLLKVTSESDFRKKTF